MLGGAPLVKRLIFGFWFIVTLSAFFPDGGFAQGGSESVKEKSGRVFLREQQIVFDGPIDKNSVEEFSRLLATPALSVSEVAISSQGGNADEGLRLAGMIRDFHLDLTVDGMCGSACAVYVLPAARTVRFSPHALVMMHHIPSPAMLDLGLKLIAADLAPNAIKAKVYSSTIRRLMAAQSEFYPSVGVSPERMFLVMDAWLELSTRLRSRHKSADYLKVAFVPDKFYLRDCLGYHVPWREFEIADSILLSRAYGKVQAFIIKGSLYFEGEKISDRDFSCKPQS
jgi:ATP-dependent protease ClpP protease subunit